MNTKQIGSMILLGAVLYVLMAIQPVYAQDSNPTAASRAGLRAVRQDNRMTLLKTRADNELTRRITSLTRLITTIGAMKRLTSDQKATLTSQMQTEITNLNTLKTKIDGDTDIATLRTDVQSIVKSYRVYALFLPQIQIIAYADRLMGVVDDMNVLVSKLQTRVDGVKSSGKDTSSMQSLLDDMKAKLTDADTQAQNAINAVLPLTPDGYPGNKTTLQSARSMLQAARTDMKTATKDAQQVRQSLKNFKPAVTPTATAASTASPTP